jgi:hypothetical protein
MKKMNMVEKFTAIKALLNGEKVEGFTVADALAFMDNRIEQTEKKNASGSNGERKPTKEQLANEGIKEQIVAFLRTQSAPVPMGEIMKAVGIESNQKVTALVSSMLTVRKGEVNPNGCIVRTEVKGKAHFAIAE